MNTPTLMQCPYVGLIPYSEEQAGYFFGREKETRLIVSKLYGARLSLLYGPSGVGKSSILRAGVLPALREDDAAMAVYFNAWQSDPVVMLRTQIGGEIPIRLLERGELDKEAAARFAERFLSAKQEPESNPQVLAADQLRHAPTLGDFCKLAAGLVGPLMIILDQFEEYFLYHPHDDNKDSFAVEFAKTMNRDDALVSFLISIREDAYTKLDRFKGRIPNLFASYAHLDHLDLVSARAAIEKPLERHNSLLPPEATPVTIEPALVDAVLDQVRTGQVVLGQGGSGVVQRETGSAKIETPFLQMVMTRLWEEELSRAFPTSPSFARSGTLVPNRRVLHLDTLTRLGGASQIVRTHLDNVMNHLAPNEQIICSSFFDRLVTPSGTKIAQTSDDLVTYAARPATEVTPVLKTLSDSRVLRPVAPPLDQPTAIRYEIFHDVLAPAVLDWRRRFVEKQTQEKAQRETASRNRRLKLTFLGAAALVFIFACLSVFAVRSSLEAQNERDVANAAKVDTQTQRDAANTAKADALIQRDAANTAKADAILQQRNALYLGAAAQSYSLLDDKLDLSLLLSLESFHYTDTVQTRGSLLNGLAYSHELSTFLRGHTDWVTHLVFSPDGKTLASGSLDKSIILWDAQSGYQISPPLKGTYAVYGLAFSPDGKTLASSSLDGNILLWDVATLKQLGAPLQGNTGIVYDVAFSPDGKILASADEHDTIILWDVASRKIITQLAGHKDKVYRVAFSPDGKTLASASADKTVILWNVVTRRPIATLQHPDEVFTLAFSPDGKLLATGGMDKNITIWDVATRKQKGEPLQGHLNSVFGIAFIDKKGTTLASVSTDKTIILWDITTMKKTEMLTGYSEGMRSIAFDLQNNRLATGSESGVIVLWNIPYTKWLGNGIDYATSIYSVAFSPTDQRIIADAQSNGNISLRNVDTGEEVGELKGHTKSVNSVAFSPDGSTLASGGGDAKIILWNVATRKPVSSIPTGYSVYSVAFSPDGKTLVSGGYDKNTTLWDLTSLSKPISTTLAGHTNSVMSVAFSPDGKKMATGSLDQTIILWDVASRQPIGKGEISSLAFSPVSSLAFSPDGKLLASGSWDTNIYLWDVATFKQIGQPLTKHKGAVQSVAFSPDGRMLASGSYDQTTILWDLATRQPVGSPLTEQAAPVSSVAFSPDGKLLVSGSESLSSQTNWSVIAWDIDPASWQSRACVIVERNFTTEEWNQYFRNEPYDVTCPEALIKQANAYALAGDVQHASALFTQSVDLVVNTSDAKMNNSACWYGSIDGFAQVVMPACQRAVDLAPDASKELYRDSRGLARALTGDYSGAIEDFQSLIDYSKGKDNYKSLSDKRASWITALKAGQNPFDAATLAALHQE